MSFNSSEPPFICGYSVVVLLCSLLHPPAEKSAFWQCEVQGLKLTTKSETCYSTAELIL